jgi:hypothetical protein
MVLVLLHIIEGFRSELVRVFEKLWIRLLEIYDDIRGIEWEWQSLDNVSVKAPLEI